MSTGSDWLKIEQSIIDCIPIPIIICSFSGEILGYNLKAGSNFRIDDSITNLNYLFEENTFNLLFNEIANLNQSTETNKLFKTDIVLNEGITRNYDVQLSIITSGTSKYLVLIFNQPTSKSTDEQLNEIEIPGDGILRELKGTKIHQLIHTIKVSYPFTIVDKKKLQVTINNFDGDVCFLNTDKRVILINNSFANELGIKTSVIENQSFCEFLSPQIKPIFNAILDFVFSTHNPIIVNKQQIKDLPSVQYKETIVLPVEDNFNKIFGILITERFIDKDHPKIVTNVKISTDYFQNFPKAMAFLNLEGKFLFASEEFCKLVDRKSSDLIKKEYFDVFPYLLSEIIKSFIFSDEDKDELNIGKDFEPKHNDDLGFTLKLSKSGVDNNEEKLVILVIEEFEHENDLQKILKRRGRMFDILFQNNPEPIFIYDKENLRFLDVNSAALQLYGYTKDEFLQMDLTDLYTPEDIQTLLDSFGEGSSEGKFSKPFRHRKKDGSFVLVEINRTNFTYNEKDAHFNIVHDITSSVEKEKQDQILKSIFENTDNLLFLTDAEGFIKYVNNSVFQKLGYSQKDLLKSSFASLALDDERALINNTIFQSHLKESVTLNISLKNKEGKFIEIETTATPVLDYKSEVDSFTILAKPVYGFEIPKEHGTEVREVVKEVIIEKPVLSKTSEDVPDANFLSGMFHEILTPMNVIIGFTQDFLESVPNPTEEQKETAELINQNRLKLLDSMNAVVEYSELVQGKYELTVNEIQVTQLIENLDSEIKQLSGLNDIEFGFGKISSSLAFYSDKSKFENLVKYLIKIVGRLSIDKKVYFSAYSLDSDSFLLSVSDQYGSSSDYLTDILTKVFIDNSDPKDFGLPKLTCNLAKILLNLLEGKYYPSVRGSIKNECGFVFPVSISKKSESGFVEPVIQQDEIPVEEFSTDVPEVSEDFIQPIPEPEITEKPLPQKDFEEVSTMSEELMNKIGQSEKEEEPHLKIDKTVLEKEQTLESKADQVQEEKIIEKPDVKSESKIVDLKSLSCLYIEDQVDSQILFKVQLKGLKDIKFAVSFEESLPILNSNKFDFIVMDINLQGEYNGLDALKIIHKMPGLENIPIIAVTAYVLPGDKEKFIAAGFDDFIAKPIFHEKMLESLERIFSKRS